MDVPASEVDDCACALHLEDGGLSVLVVVGGRLVDQLGQHPRMTADAFERPAEGGCGRFVPGGQQRQQFVADVTARHRRAVLIRAAQKQREDVVAAVEVRVCPDTVDQPADDVVVLAPVFGESAPRAVPAEGSRRSRQYDQVRGEGDPRRDDAPQLVKLFAVGAEHRAQDGVESDAHHRRKCRKRLAFRPIR